MKTKAKKASILGCIAVTVLMFQNCGGNEFSTDRLGSLDEGFSKEDNQHVYSVDVMADTNKKTEPIDVVLLLDDSESNARNIESILRGVSDLVNELPPQAVSLKAYRMLQNMSNKPGAKFDVVEKKNRVKVGDNENSNLSSEDREADGANSPDGGDGYDHIVYEYKLPEPIAEIKAEDMSVSSKRDFLGDVSADIYKYMNYKSRYNENPKLDCQLKALVEQMSDRRTVFLVVTDEDSHMDDQLNCRKRIEERSVTKSYSKTIPQAYLSFEVEKTVEGGVKKWMKADPFNHAQSSQMKSCSRAHINEFLRERPFYKVSPNTYSGCQEVRNDRFAYYRLPVLKQMGDGLWKEVTSQPSIGLEGCSKSQVDNYVKRRRGRVTSQTYSSCKISTRRASGKNTEVLDRVVENYLSGVSEGSDADESEELTFSEVLAEKPAFFSFFTIQDESQKTNNDQRVARLLKGYFEGAVRKNRVFDSSITNPDLVSFVNRVKDYKERTELRSISLQGIVDKDIDLRAIRISKVELISKDDVLQIKKFKINNDRLDILDEDLDIQGDVTLKIKFILI
jgi:hypothetical protein